MQTVQVGKAYCAVLGASD